MRGSLRSKGDLNWDVIIRGKQIDSMSQLLPGDILFKQGGIEVSDLASISSAARPRVAAAAGRIAST
jgi:hypothetical protein